MSGETILVVDDEAHIVELAQMYLEQAGFRVRTAGDGAEALEAVEREPPALLVLDLMLPEVDGWDVCRRVRSGRSAPQLPIIMLTARDEDLDRILGLELGADDYVTKPFDVEELNLRVGNAMARSEYESLTSPTTGLPGGQLIEQRLRQLVPRDGWGIVYVGVKRLGQFGEAYGFVASEEVLRFTAMILIQTVDRLGTLDDFIGHVGSDEFIVVTEKERAPRLAQKVKERFDANVGTHYNWQAREQGYLVVEDEDGHEVKADLMTLTAGVVTADDGPFADIREITEAAAEARRQAARADQEQG